MEIEHALAIITDTIKDLKQIKPRGTGIYAPGARGLVVEDCEFRGLEKALDAPESQDITWKRNIVDNYDKYSGLLGLLEQFLAEANQINKKEKQANRGVLVRTKDEILKRWPELVGTFLFVAMMRTIEVL